MNTAVENEIIRALDRRAEGAVDAAALRIGAVARARRVRLRRRIVAALAAIAVLAGGVGAVEILRNTDTRDQSAEQRGNGVPKLPKADVPGALQRPDSVATDPSVIHFDVDAAALNAVELTWRSVWTREDVLVRTANDSEHLIHFTISKDADARWIARYPAGDSFPRQYRNPALPYEDGGKIVPDPREPVGEWRNYEQVPVDGAPGTVGRLRGPADGTPRRYRMMWNPVPGLTASLEMVTDNPQDLVRTSRAFRLDRSQRCAMPGTARGAPSDARFFECETSLRTPDADGAFWNYSIITFSARAGNYLDVLFGALTIPQPFEANATANGRPARWYKPSPTVDAFTLEVPGGPGHQLIVSVRSWNFTEAEVQRVADSFQFSGDPRDIRTWPANPAP